MTDLRSSTSASSRAGMRDATSASLAPQSGVSAYDQAVKERSAFVERMMRRRVASRRILEPFRRSTADKMCGRLAPARAFGACIAVPPVLRPFEAPCKKECGFPAFEVRALPRPSLGTPTPSPLSRLAVTLYCRKATKAKICCRQARTGERKRERAEKVES